MDTFQFQKNGIQNHIFRVAANVMEITPIALWVERFQTILTPEQWIVNTITEKLIADGASMPRLIFHHVNGVEKIVIGINRLEFRFQFWTEKEHSIVERCLKLIDENIQTRYCHMDVETNANLGTIREYQALKTEHFLQSRTFRHDGIFSKELLEMDYCVHPEYPWYKRSPESSGITVSTHLRRKMSILCGILRLMSWTFLTRKHLLIRNGLHIY